MTIFVQLGEWFGFDGTYWSPFIYQYGVGLLLMIIGVWAGSRNNVWPKGRRGWLVPVIGGWFFFMIGQGAFHQQGTPTDSSLQLAQCVSTLPSGVVESENPSDVCLELGYQDNSREDFTLDHRTQWDDVSGDPSDLFRIEITVDDDDNPTRVSIVPTGKGVGTATLKVGFSHSQLTAETQVRIVKGQDYTFTAGALEEPPSDATVRVTTVAVEPGEES